MQWLERFIAFLSPEEALRRKQAQLALRLADELAQKRGYDGAKRGRLQQGWDARGTSSNSEISRAAPLLRARSRDLVRNNPYAAKAKEVYQHHMVGTGIVPSSPKEKTNKLWEEWSRRCDASGHFDFYGLQGLMAGARFESGACLIRRRWRRPGDGLRVPMQIEVLEIDHLDTTKDSIGGMANGNIVVRGIEFDAIGRRVAYWLFPEHPGETGRVMRRGVQSRRVPAEDVIHLYRKERPGQDDGVPALAPVLLKLRDLDGYDEAELIRKQISSCLGVFIQTPDGAGGAVIGAQAAKTDSAGSSYTEEKLRAGMITRLKPGEEPHFVNPPSDPFYTQYVNAQLHAVATGTGIPYELLTGDLSMVNYSSIRAGLLEFRAMIEAHRWQMFIPVACEQVWRWFIDAAFLAGEVPAQDYTAEWTPSGYAMTDVEKETKGKRLMLESGLATWAQAVREQGYDPDQQLREIAEWQEKAAKLGVTLNFGTGANAAPAQDENTKPHDEQKESKDAEE